MYLPRFKTLIAVPEALFADDIDVLVVEHDGRGGDGARWGAGCDVGRRRPAGGASHGRHASTATAEGVDGCYLWPERRRHLGRDENGEKRAFGEEADELALLWGEHGVYEVCARHGEAKIAEKGVRTLF